MAFIKKINEIIMFLDNSWTLPFTIGLNNNKIIVINKRKILNISLIAALSVNIDIQILLYIMYYNDYPI